MPNRDGTGPFGDGCPGKGFGPCGQGIRLGNGFGRMRRQVCHNYTDLHTVPISGGFYKYNKEELQAQKDELEKQIQWIDKQMENM